MHVILILSKLNPFDDKDEMPAGSNLLIQLI